MLREIQLNPIPVDFLDCNKRGVDRAGRIVDFGCDFVVAPAQGQQKLWAMFVDSVELAIDQLPFLVDYAVNLVFDQRRDIVIVHFLFHIGKLLEFFEHSLQLFAGQRVAQLFWRDRRGPHGRCACREPNLSWQNRRLRAS